jgi:phenylpropionate dioxygenase-like ring-hydroxylating dioxygenase large terminal subunit
MQNQCPHKKDMVLARGILGDQGGTPKVACPLHKKTFSLEDGKCLNDDKYCVSVFEVQVRDGSVFVELPSVAEAERAFGATARPLRVESLGVIQAADAPAPAPAE